MKKNRILSLLTAAALAVTALSSCGSTPAPAEDGKLKIGVIQFAPHPSLDNCYEGIAEGLKASKYGDKVEIGNSAQRAQSKEIKPSPTRKLTQISTK